MARSNSAVSRGVAARFSEAIAKLQKPGDYVTIVRGLPRSIVMACPDGCGETLTVNLDGRAGAAWRKYERGGKLTVYPSVWRKTGCKAHFIIWKDQIIWCGPHDNWRARTDDHALVERVLASLPRDNYMHYEALAECLDAIPWDVYWAATELAKLGKASEGKRGEFRRIEEGDTPATAGTINIRV